MISLDSTTLTYDALGRMVEQNQSGTYFQIVYSPTGKKLAMMKAQVIQQAFVPLPGHAKAEYLSWGLSHYRHPDWLGSSRLESSTSHGIVQDTAYDPFGVPYSEKSGGNGEISFTGQNKDTAWLDYDFLHRELDPNQGRWLSPDHTGLAAVDPASPQSWNRYAYVQNNPLSLIDPFGDQCYDQSNHATNDSKTFCLSVLNAGGSWYEGMSISISLFSSGPSTQSACTQFGTCQAGPVSTQPQGSDPGTSGSTGGGGSSSGGAANNGVTAPPGVPKPPDPVKQYANCSSQVHAQAATDRMTITLIQQTSFSPIEAACLFTGPGAPECLGTVGAVNLLNSAIIWGSYYQSVWDGETRCMQAP